MAKNINKRPFDEATKLKLKIFGESFEEWLPVFIYDKYTTQVSIFDFFAGSGTDKVKRNKKLNGKEIDGKKWQQYPEVIEQQFVVV